MPYDHGLSEISKATGLTGVEAKHIAMKLKEMNVDPQTIDWAGAISDARDYGDRYNAVKKYLANYYGLNVDVNMLSSYQQPKYEHDVLADQATTKKGVKTLLKEYYSTDSKRKKDAIRDMLLNEQPLYNVLMTAMYNGTDIPNAKKFIKEALGEQAQEQFHTPAVVVAKKPIEQPVVVAKPRNGNGNKTRNGNGKKPIEPNFSVDIDDVYKSLPKQTPAVPTEAPQKPSFFNKLTEGAKKEASLWGKLITGQNVTKLDPKAALAVEIKRLKAANEPLRLQLQREQLIMQRQQLIQLQKLQKQRDRATATQEVLQIFGFVPSPPHPLHRPGFVIEYRPRLPKGYRYKKAPKGKQKKPEPVRIY